PNFVASDAVPWLLLQVVGAHPGPMGGNLLMQTTFIQRVNTSGGIAPSTGCTESTDVGGKVLVPYTADYFFYKTGSGNCKFGRVRVSSEIANYPSLLKLPNCGYGGPPVSSQFEIA